jgi:hypothetical protein
VAAARIQQLLTLTLTLPVVGEWLQVLPSWQPPASSNWDLGEGKPTRDQFGNPYKLDKTHAVRVSRVGRTGAGQWCRATVLYVLNNVLNSKPESVLNHCVKPNLVSLIGILSPQARSSRPVETQESLRRVLLKC